MWQQQQQQQHSFIWESLWDTLSTPVNTTHLNKRTQLHLENRRRRKERIE